MYHQPFWFINEKKSEQASLLSVRKVVLFAFIMLVSLVILNENQRAN